MVFRSFGRSFACLLFDVSLFIQFRWFTVKQTCDSTDAESNRVKWQSTAVYRVLVDLCKHGPCYDMVLQKSNKEQGESTGKLTVSLPEVTKKLSNLKKKYFKNHVYSKKDY